MWVQPPTNSKRKKQPIFPVAFNCDPAGICFSFSIGVTSTRQIVISTEGAHQFVSPKWRNPLFYLYFNAANASRLLLPFFVIPQGSAFSFAIFCPKIACQAPQTLPTAQNPTTTHLSHALPFGKLPGPTAYH
jgi:hypothetical protein